MDPVGPCRTLAHLLHHCHNSSSHCAMFSIITFGSPSSLPTLSYSLTSTLCVLTSSHRWFLCPSLVVEAGKDAGYIGFILAGIGVAGVLFWAVFSEFFSSNSPQKLFAKALRRIKSNEQVRQYSAVCAIHLLCMFVLFTHVYWQMCVCLTYVPPVMVSLGMFVSGPASLLNFNCGCSPLYPAVPIHWCVQCHFHKIKSDLWKLKCTLPQAMNEFCLGCCVALVVLCALQAKQVLGEPISGFGDHSGRGRRRHIR